MKKTNKKQAAAWLLSLLPLVMIAAVYRRLPADTERFFIFVYG